MTLALSSMFVFWQKVASPQESLLQLRVSAGRAAAVASALVAAITEVLLPPVRCGGLLGGGGGVASVVAALAVRGVGVLLGAAGPGHRGLVGGGLACGRLRRDQSAAAGAPV